MPLSNLYTVYLWENLCMAHNVSSKVLFLDPNTGSNKYSQTPPLDIISLECNSYKMLKKDNEYQDLLDIICVEAIIKTKLLSLRIS